jgi:hypothetical protein
MISLLVERFDQMKWVSLLDCLSLSFRVVFFVLMIYDILSFCLNIICFGCDDCSSAGLKQKSSMPVA